eukprot:m.57649 g.57649  ORF g.57649 m.57649 type:complete len:363 (-) comp11122_c1_seq3:162-1250(-)
MTSESSAWVVHKGPNWFRQRLVMATLAGRNTRFEEVRQFDDNPGLNSHEASFLRLIDKLCNGTRIDINHTGTVIKYRPGIIFGGKVVHDCALSRAIGYYLEAVISLAPFAKKPVHLILRGVTNLEIDPSVDIIRTVTLPLLRRFGLEDGLELKISKRGNAPDGGGEVIFRCPIIRRLSSVQFINFGKIKRIRGIAYSARVSPATPSRVVDSARQLLNNLLPDVYIYSDHYRGEEAGNSPGFGLSLVAESTEGALISADCVARPGELPEDLGKRASKYLLQEVSRQGCVDTQHQAFCLLLMVLCPEDVSKVRFGQLSSFTIQYMRDIRQYFGVTFKIVTDSETKTCTLSALGVGFSNFGKKMG